MKIMPSYRSSRDAIALRYEDVPFTLPHSKDQITAEIQNSKGQLGITNTPIYFNGNRSKGTNIYLDTFDDSRRKQLLELKASLEILHVLLG